ncbi:related to cross-pathway control protein [Cephalotrichum gorgonifer]|uniref:Cross-pathway control protein 1 n=1 Tax=Cephalotrichum gorgonifer TaxID=2041049 RepID=A0AAE8MXQ0_9PEZI|nr:related to cross-pathway control protein [Cephalotrichum gorgonifer]
MSQSGISRPPVPFFSQRPVSVPQSPVGMDFKDIDFDDLHNLEQASSATAYSSPAMASIFDVTGSATGPMGNIGTVSPQDLLIHEPYMSAPNSTALTALTSPSIYNGSPDFNDTFMSPNIDGGDLDNSDPWYSLFPPDGTLDHMRPGQSPNQESSTSESVQSATRQKKRKSTDSTSHTRQASGSGVGSRRREKPLPPITVDDPTDVVAMKRARNTLAARKSRQRKSERFDELERRIQDLEVERDYWKRLAQEHGAA